MQAGLPLGSGEAGRSGDDGLWEKNNYSQFPGKGTRHTMQGHSGKHQGPQESEEAKRDTWAGALTVEAGLG